MTIQEAWNKRRDLRAEGDRLHAAGTKLHIEGGKLVALGAKLHAKGDKFYAAGNKLLAEGDKLVAEGDFAFYNAVIFHHGNVEIKWEGEDCEVCGVKYLFQEPSAPCEGKIVEFDGVKYKLSKM